HPQQRVEKPPIVRARAALTAPAAWNKVLEPFPLVVTKSVAVHRCSPKNSVESDLRAFGNPKTLNCHYALVQHKRVTQKKSDVPRLTTAAMLDLVAAGKAVGDKRRVRRRRAHRGQ